MSGTNRPKHPEIKTTVKEIKASKSLTGLLTTPITTIGDFHVLKPILHYTNHIDLIRASQLTDPEKECKTHLLTHENNIMALAPLYFKGYPTGLVAVSDKMVSVWKDEKALERGKSSTTVELKPTSSVYMNVFHIPDTEEIIILKKDNLNSLRAVKLNINTKQVLLDLKLPFTNSCEVVAYVAPETIAFKSEAGGSIDCFDLAKQKMTSYPIKKLDHFCTSPDGRLLLATIDVTSTLRKQEHELMGDTSADWGCNENYRQLRLYHMSSKGLVYKQRLAEGTEDKPQFLLNNCIAYIPTYEYYSHFYIPIIPEYLSMEFDRVERSYQNNRGKIYLYNPFQNKTELLSTQLEDTNNEFYVSPSGEVFKPSISQERTHLLSVVSDPVLKMEIEREYKLKGDEVDAALEKVMAAPLRNIIKEYADALMFKPHKIHNRFLIDSSERTISSGLKRLIAKHEKVVDDLKKLQKSDQGKEKKLTSPEIKKLRKANRCLDCLRRFEEITAPKKLSFTECVNIIWEEYPDIKKHGEGLKKLVGGSYKEIYDLIEYSKSLDTHPSDIIRPNKKYE